MTQTPITGRVDFRRHPYRGIISEVAREMGKTQQAISARVNTGDPVVLAIVTAKMHEREAVVAAFAAKLEKAAA